MSRPRFVRLAVAPALVSLVAVVGLAACGSSSGSPAGDRPAAPTTVVAMVDGEEKMTDEEKMADGDKMTDGDEMTDGDKMTEPSTTAP